MTDSKGKANEEDYDYMIPFPAQCVEHETTKDYLFQKTTPLYIPKKAIVELILAVAMH